MRKRKLELHRETLGRMGSGRIRQIAGAGDTYELATGCACTDGCDTGYWCGTYYACPTAGCQTEGCNTYEIYSGCATNCG